MKRPCSNQKAFEKTMPYPANNMKIFCSTNENTMLDNKFYEKTFARPPKRILMDSTWKSRLCNFVNIHPLPPLLKYFDFSISLRMD